MAIKKILIVEDNLDYAQVIKETIEDSGELYEIKMVPDGNEALTFLHSGGNADVLITDQRMPIIEGLVLAENVQNNFPDTTIVLISAFLSLDEFNKAKEMGLKYILHKPIDGDELLGIIKSHKLK